MSVTSPDETQATCKIENRQRDSSSAANNSFYTPLPTPTSIRLLELLPSEPGTISCSLATLDLEDKPEFDALSYTWGSPITIHEKPESKSADQHYRDLLSEAEREQNTVLVNLQSHAYYYQRSSIPYENIDWDTARKKVIKCNGYEFLVSENLFDALTELHRRMYNRDGGRAEDSFQPILGKRKAKYTWIDAICINQDDILERNAQVGSMSRIYEAAQLVLGWLGPEDFFSESAIDTFHTIVASISHDPDWHGSFKGDIQQWQGIKEVEWIAVFAFLQRLWFRRAWILQEVIMAQQMVLLCGATSIVWDFVQVAVSVLSATKLNRSITNLASQLVNCGPSSGFIKLPSKCGIRLAFAPWNVQVRQPLALKVDPRLCYRFVSGIQSIRSLLGKPVMVLLSEAARKSPLFTGDGGGMLKEIIEMDITRTGNKSKILWITERPEPTPVSFSTLLKTFRGYQATDPRDNIFALLSIARDFSNLTKDHPLANANYNRTASEIYTEVAGFLLRESNNLKLLSEVQDIGMTFVQGLPSWVPDFSVSRGLEPFSDDLNFSAWGNIVPLDLSFETKNRLGLTGIFVDTVAAVASSEGSYFAQTAKIALKTPAWYLHENPQIIGVKFPIQVQRRPHGFLPLDHFEIDGGTESDLERSAKAISRVEAYWRTLIADNGGGNTPAPIEYGFGFSDWVALSVKDSVKETALLNHLQNMGRATADHLKSNQVLTTGPCLSVDLITAQVLEAGELGGFHSLEEWRQKADAIKNACSPIQVESSNGTTLRLRSFDPEMGGMRFMPDHDRMKTLMSYKSNTGFEENQGRFVILQDDDRRSADEANRSAFFEARLEEVKEGRRMFRSKRCYLGMGPASVDVGDEIWLLRGATVPFILRRQEEGVYRLIGEAYMHGIMHGEAVEGRENQFQRIVIV